MEKIVDDKKCCGCTACYNTCPKNAIKMVLKEDGFRYPVIDQSKCINCGLCKKVCPVINTNKSKSINKCYVGFSRNGKLKEKASSGGIFPLIATYILDNGGYVIGATFDDNNDLNHVVIDSKKSLSKIMGSKYLQSNLNDIFTFVKKNVVSKKILFVGTPCQVAGLKMFLKKDYENLICIDLICHGVPSLKLFKKYLNDIEKKNNSKVINCNFRDKSTGWESYSTTISFNDKKVSKNHNDDNYMKLFLSDIALRESCYNCNFKLGNKYSDITLGDFWGVKKYYPEMYNDGGVSAIIINTDKGKIVFNLIKNDIIFKDCRLEEIVEGNPSLEKSARLSKNREVFFEELDNRSIDYLVSKYKKKISLKMKIKIKVKKMLKR